MNRYYQFFVKLKDKKSHYGINNIYNTMVITRSEQEISLPGDTVVQDSRSKEIQNIIFESQKIIFLIFNGSKFFYQFLRDLIFFFNF